MVPSQTQVQELYGLVGQPGAFTNPTTQSNDAAVAQTTVLLSQIAAMTIPEVVPIGIPTDNFLSSNEAQQLTVAIKTLYEADAVLPDNTIGPSGALADFQAHTDDQTNNMMERANTVASWALTGGRVGINLEPCADKAKKIFGSLLGDGQGLLDEVKQVLDTIKNALAAGAQYVRTVIGVLLNAVVQLVSKITGFIAQEIAELAGIANDLKNLARSYLIGSIFDDDCLKEVVKATASVAILNALDVPPPILGGV